MQRRNRTDKRYLLYALPGHALAFYWAYRLYWALIIEPSSTLPAEISLTSSLPKQTQVLACARRCTSHRAAVNSDSWPCSRPRATEPKGVCEALCQQLSTLAGPGGFCLPAVQVSWNTHSNATSGLPRLCCSEPPVGWTGFTSLVTSFPQSWRTWHPPRI